MRWNFSRIFFGENVSNALHTIRNTFFSIISYILTLHPLSQQDVRSSLSWNEF